MKLRRKGMYMGDIAKRLKASKSSVSYWVRDVKLTKSQRNKLNSKGHSVNAIEKRRISRLANTKARHEAVIAEAMCEAEELSGNKLWCVGVLLYWCVGGKTQNIVRISNSDPVVIQTMMNFFKNVCGVDSSKFRGHIHIFSHSDVEKAEKYWPKVSGVKRSQFYKTYQKQSSTGKKKIDSLPNGTFQLYVHEKDLFLKMMGWIEYLKKNHHA